MRAILTYHAIDHSGSVISVTPECFQAQLDSLVEAGVQVVNIPELLALPDTIDAVALTFDDALESVATEAAPRLTAHQLPATVFVATEQVGRDNRWGGKSDAGISVAPVLTWDALGTLAATGWAIGSHSRTHPHLTTCSDGELTDELEGSAEAIAQHLGSRPTAFAYPFGDYDARVATATAQCYAQALTTHHLPLADEVELGALPRIDSWYFQSPSAFRDWGSRRFRRGIVWRHALRRVRRLIK